MFYTQKIILLGLDAAGCDFAFEMAKYQNKGFDIFYISDLETEVGKETAESLELKPCRVDEAASKEFGVDLIFTFTENKLLVKGLQNSLFVAENFSTKIAPSSYTKLLWNVIGPETATAKSQFAV